MQSEEKTPSAVYPFSFTAHAAGGGVFHSPKVLFTSSLTTNSKSVLRVSPTAWSRPAALWSYSEAKLQSEMNSGQSHKIIFLCLAWQSFEIFLKL